MNAKNIPWGWIITIGLALYLPTKHSHWVLLNQNKITPSEFCNPFFKYTPAIDTTTNHIFENDFWKEGSLGEDITKKDAEVIHQKIKQKGFKNNHVKLRENGTKYQIAITLIFEDSSLYDLIEEKTLPFFFDREN